MLFGKTISLRPVEQGDLDLLTAWWNDPDAFDVAAGRWPVTRAEIEKRVGRGVDTEKSGEFLMVLSDTRGGPDETAAGHISFSVPSRIAALKCYDIGFSVFPQHRGKGYAAMAGRLLVNQLFNTTRAHRIQGHCLDDNSASRRVMEEVGMTLEGTLRGAAYCAGRFRDVLLLSILRTDWGDTERYSGRFGGL